MHAKLQQKYNLQIPHHTVAELQRQLDPDGVTSRSYSRLVKRPNVSSGPVCSWHVDGYVKLKPFGFAVSGYIDGYSRCIL